MKATKTNPAHKAKLLYGVRARCSCGWEAVGHWYGKGARGNAVGEWRLHREKCEAVEKGD
jgi:hypothetical protein